MPPDAATALLVAGPADALGHLEPLIDAHRRSRPVRVMQSSMPAARDLEGVAAVLWVAPATASAEDALPGVFLRTADGIRVPVGYVPDLGEQLRPWAQAAAEVALREGQAPGPFIFLAELNQRSNLAADGAKAAMKAGEVFDWTAQRLRRADLLAALRCGPGAAFYFGHAGPDGWFGYGGIDAGDIAAIGGSAMGAVLSLSCWIAARPAVGPSFAESLILHGACAVVLGATQPTLHAHNTALGVELSRAITAGAGRLAAALLDPVVSEAALQNYRVVGDPLALLCGAHGAAVAARTVFAPAPDAVLPQLPFDAW